MKRVLFTSVVLLFSIFSLFEVTIAEGIGMSANGTFQISLENGRWRHIEFEARVNPDGNTIGEIAFHDSGTAVTDGTGSIDRDVHEEQPHFYAKAACDCLIVNGVEAVLGGRVTDSSHKNLIGRRVLLTVQDGDGFTPRLRDKLTFGFYRTTFRNWVATDGERLEEDRYAPAWLATDFERADDFGILSHRSEEVTCNSFPLSAYSFMGAKQGKGRIQVTH